MERIHIKAMLPVLAIAFGLVLLAGCKDKDKDSGSSKSADGSGSASSAAAADPNAISGTGDAEAVKALSDELGRRWLLTADGWLSEFPSKTYIATGERAGPESYYRQIKQLKFDVQSSEVSDTDKLNGISFRANCQFTQTSVRVYNDPNAFGRPAWSEWRPLDPTVAAVKKNGKWDFAGIMGSLLSGTKPAAGTLSQLK